MKTLSKLWNGFEFIIMSLVCIVCAIPIVLVGSFFEYMSKNKEEK